MGGAWKMWPPDADRVSARKSKGVGENGFRTSPGEASAIWSAPGCKSRHAIPRRTMKRDTRAHRAVSGSAHIHVVDAQHA